MNKNTFKYYGFHLWNLLPTDIKKCMDVDTVKTLIISWDEPCVTISYVLFYNNINCQYL